MASLTAVARRIVWRLRPPVLALGGGGARGFAHLGVLQALDGAGLPVRGIVGTSMGAVAGGMYLAHGSAARAIELWREALERHLIPAVRSLDKVPDADEKEHPLIQVARRVRSRIVVSFAMNRSTILEGNELDRALDFLIPELDFRDLPKGFVVVATDLETGEEIRLREGPLRTAIEASSAVPGVVPAVRLVDRWLVDGGVVAEVPVAAARAEGWPVAAVDVSMDVPPIGVNDLVLDTMMRTQLMTARLLRRRQLRSATWVVRPQVGAARWAEWHRFEEFVEAGRAAARTFLGLADSPAPDSG